MIDSVLIITLQKIKIYCLERKADLLRGGRGLVEPEIPDKPQEQDYLVGDAEAVEDLPAIEQAPKPQLVGKILDDSAEPIQIDIETALKNSVRERTTIQAANTPKDEEQNIKIDCVSPLPSQQEQPEEYSNRFSSFLAALKEWRVRKKNLEYDYYRNKRAVLDNCYGYDDVIRYIDEIIKEFKDNSNTDINAL